MAKKKTAKRKPDKRKRGSRVGDCGGSDKERQAAWQAKFLERLEHHNRVTLAAVEVGIGISTVYLARKNNRDFRLAMARARQLFVERNAANLEAELVRRALDNRDPKTMDTPALLAALKRFDAANYDKPKERNVNVGGQPGNQLPAPPPQESSITVIRIADIRNYDDAQEFRRIQQQRRVIEDRANESDSPDVDPNANGNGHRRKTSGK